MVVSIDETMGDASEADHVNLVLVPDYEVLGRQIGKVLESSGLVVVNAAIYLKGHGDGVVQIDRLLVLFLQFFLGEGQTD